MVEVVSVRTRTVVPHDYFQDNRIQLRYKQKHHHTHKEDDQYDGLEEQEGAKLGTQI